MLSEVILNESQHYWFLKVPAVIAKTTSFSNTITANNNNCTENSLHDEIINYISSNWKCTTNFEPIFEYYFIIYSVVYRQNNNYSRGATQTISFNMAHLFQDNSVRYPTTIDEHKVLQSCAILTDRLREHITDQNIIDKFSMSVQTALINELKCVNNLAILQENCEFIRNLFEFDASWRDGQYTAKQMCEKLIDWYTNPDKLKTLSEQIITAFVVNSVHDGVSPNIIINRLYKENQQDVLSVKKIKLIGSSGDSTQTIGDKKRNNISLFGKLFSKQLPIDMADFMSACNELAKLSLSNMHVCINAQDLFYSYKLQCSRAFLFGLVAKNLIYLFVVHTMSDISDIWTITVYVHQRCHVLFLQKLRRFMRNKIQTLATTSTAKNCTLGRTVLAIYLPTTFSYEQVTNFHFIDSFDNLPLAKMLLFSHKSMVFNAGKLQRLKLPHTEIVDIYCILSSAAFIYLLANETFHFFVTSRIEYKTHVYYYIHIFAIKEFAKTIYRVLYDFYSFHKRELEKIQYIEEEGHLVTASQEFSSTSNAFLYGSLSLPLSSSSKNGISISPLDWLWIQRVPVQILYTTDLESVSDKKKYIQNYVFASYIRAYAKVTPWPDNMSDATALLVMFLRVMKCLVSNKKNFYFVNNCVDGPLKNVISIRAIESLADPQVNDITFVDNTCTTLRTVLNCPSTVDMQSSSNALFG